MVTIQSDPRHLAWQLDRDDLGSTRDLVGHLLMHDVHLRCDEDGDDDDDATVNYSIYHAIILWL